MKHTRELHTSSDNGAHLQPVDVSAIVRTGHRRPQIHKYTVGIEREIGWNIVADVAHVGEFTRNIIDDDWDHNAIPAGARFLPENRDLTLTPSEANPRGAA